MNRYTGIVATLLIGLSLSLGSISDAEAKRFGGGSSFGGRSSFSQPYKRSVDAPARSATQQQQQQQYSQPNQAAKPSWGRGLMGMLGGLALGGLLGSLLAGGAFQGINFLDILVLGVLAFMLYKFFAAKKAREQQPVYDRAAGQYDNSASAYTPYQEPRSGSSNPAGFDTDILFKKDKPGVEPAVQSFQQDADFGQAIDVPAGFDTQAFLAGAKTAFKALQKAWDDRDLAEIRGLTTDKVFAEIQDQLKASSEENRTDILKLEAELLEVREVGSELQAVVLFDTIMREDSNAQANQVREVWHFIKPKNSIQPTWYLDGIQQLED